MKQRRGVDECAPFPAGNLRRRDITQGNHETNICDDPRYSILTAEKPENPVVADPGWH